jgi:hypothetical protein
MYAAASFQVGYDEEFLRCRVVLDAQGIGFAANLAVFDVTLLASSGFIHCGRIPLAAACTLKTSFHDAIISRSFVSVSVALPKYRHWAIGYTKIRSQSQKCYSF